LPVILALSLNENKGMKNITVENIVAQINTRKNFGMLNGILSLYSLYIFGIRLN
jgi:hypothetical protein